MARARPSAGQTAATLVLPTKMTIDHAAGIRAALLEAVAAGAVKLDFAHVLEFDSVGLQLLLAARRTARAGGRHLELLNLPPIVQDVCAAYGLADALEPSFED